MSRSNKSNIQIVQDYLEGVRPFIQVGYVGDANKYRKDGEKWVDKDGVEWEKRDGKSIRLTKTQGEIVREAIGDTLDCKKCGMKYKWAGKFDLKFLARTGLCESCLIEYETKLRILGIYPDYEKYKLLSYELGSLKTAKEHISAAIDFFSKSNGDVTMLCNSEGFIERWKNTNQNQIVDDARKELETVNNRIEELAKLVVETKEKYKIASEKYGLDCYA